MADATNSKACHAKSLRHDRAGFRTFREFDGAGGCRIRCPPRFAAASEPPDAELERGILDAVRMGLADVARTLAAQLDARQLATGGKVVPLDQSKRRGR